MNPNPRGRGLPDQEPGRPISARWLSRVKNAALGDVTAGPGMIETTVAGRKVLRRLGAAAEVVRVQIPAGGIADGVTTACRYYGADHTLSATGDTIDVANRAGVLVGDAGVATIGWASWIAREAEFQITNRVC